MRTLLAATAVFVFTSSVQAQVGDPTLKTDHPQYPGVGAFQTIEDCVAFATAGKTTPQEKAIALYNWLLTHQWHLHSPQEWCIPGRVPDTEQTRDYENVVYDANIGRFSYGYGLCGTVHAWNEPYWQALGMRARRRAFPGHVNSEVFYDGAWHAFDTDMAGLLFRRDGVVAGYKDVIADPSLVDSTKPPHPHYPFAWPSDFNAMKKGWQQVADGGHWYAMYNGGYAAQPGIIHLRKGETFTRYYDPDHYGGPSMRRFWHHMKNGPRRPWSFYGQDEPHHDGATHNARNDVSYCNGEFVWRPTEPWLRIGNFSGIGPKHSFKHWSPYVIAGDPVDDANPMTGRATGGLVVTGTANDGFELEVSNDGGWTWHDIDPVLGADQFPHEFKIDLTEHVKGRFGWRVNLASEYLRLPIDNLEFTTVTQISPSMYPTLTPESCEVAYRATSRIVAPFIPSLSVADREFPRYEFLEFRSPNVTFQPRSENNRLVYRTTNNKPGQVVFDVFAPDMLSRTLSEIRAAVRYQLHVPPPRDADYHLDISTDNGKTWQTFATADIPTDNEHSSGWLAGKIDVSDADVDIASVRVHLDGGGHKTGLIDARLYGIYETEPAGPLTITYGWKENGQPREHTEKIAAGTNESTFTVPTGANIEDDFVRLTAH